LGLVKNDLRIGAKTGWIGVDPDGVHIRVRDEVAFLVGD